MNSSTSYHKVITLTLQERSTDIHLQTAPVSAFCWADQVHMADAHWLHSQEDQQWSHDQRPANQQAATSTTALHTARLLPGWSVPSHTHISKFITKTGQLLYFYTGVIRPVLEYVVPVWNHLLTKTQIDQIEAIQRWAFRIIYSYTNDMPYISVLYCAAIPSLADRREQHSRKFLKSILEPSSCLFTLLPNPRDPSVIYYPTKICK